MAHHFSFIGYRHFIYIKIPIICWILPQEFLPLRPIKKCLFSSAGRATHS